MPADPETMLIGIVASTPSTADDALRLGAPERARPGVALPYRFVRVTPSPRATREGGEHGLFPCRHADGRSQDLAAPRVTACSAA